MSPKKKRSRILPWLGSAAAVTGTAVAGTLATEPDTAWFRGLRKPTWYPPRWAFPVAWTALYADIAIVSGKILSDEDADARAKGRYARALAVNLVLNAGWSYTFFKARKLGPAAVVAGLLAASSSHLAKQAGEHDPKLGVALAPYSAWTSFATALSADIWKRNKA